jgi:uncharacterized protein GlcG (DUF336 family)
MNGIKLRNCITEMLEEIGRILPIYMQNPIDYKKNDGNVSVCVVDPFGNVYGKMYGGSKLTQRNTFKIAWIKASQVWITGMKTREYEKLVFNGLLNEKDFGIEAPDLIGWLGGQPVTLKDGTVLSIGFSGFRGEIDLEIVIIALTNLNYL